MNTQSIGAIIKKLREERNYTQEYMASQLGISQVSYSRMERDEIRLKPDKIKKLAAVLQVEPEQISASLEHSHVYHFTGQAGQNSQFHSKIETVNYYAIDKHVQKLYEDQIALLREKIIYLEEQVAYYRGKPA